MSNPENKKPRVMILKPGYEWNPLTKVRNYDCLCGSGKKTKRCCGRHMTLPTEIAKGLRGLMKKQGI